MRSLNRVGRVEGLGRIAIGIRLGTRSLTQGKRIQKTGEG